MYNFYSTVSCFNFISESNSLTNIWKSLIELVGAFPEFELVEVEYEACIIN